MTEKKTNRRFAGPSLADAVANLTSGQSSLGEEGKPLASQVERVAEFLQRDLTELPADWRQIKLIIDAEIGEGWRGLKLPSNEAWKTIKWRAKKGIEGAFINAKLDPLKGYGRGALLPAWKEFMAGLDAGVKAEDVSEWSVFSITGLSRFASARGVNPQDVDVSLFKAWIADFEALAKAAGKLVRGGNVRGPGRRAYDSARAWNKLVISGAISGNIIVMEGLRTNRDWNQPISSFHPELRNEIECHFDWLRKSISDAARESAPDEDNPFGAYATGEYKHVRMPETTAANLNAPLPREDPATPGTIKRYTHLIRFAVNAVAKERKVPVSSIRSLSEVVNADGAAKCLKVHLNRQINRGKWDPRRSSLHNIAGWIHGVAKAWCRLDEEQLARIRAMMKDPRVRTESVGRMSAERRDALKNIHHGWFVKIWVNAPAEMVAECKNPNGSFKLDERSRKTMRAAVALAIGQIVPLRLENLATFTISGQRPTLVRPRLRTGVWTVDVPADEIKNKNGAFGLLDEHTSKIIADYIEHVRPTDLAAYAERESHCLFPGAQHSEHRKDGSMGHLGLNLIGEAISSRLEKQGLVALTAHMIRHITATLILAWRPNLIQTVADLLCDTIETVEKHYVRGDTAAAVKMNLAMIEQHLRSFESTYTKIDKALKRKSKKQEMQNAA